MGVKLKQGDVIFLDTSPLIYLTNDVKWKKYRDGKVALVSELAAGG